MKTKLNFVEYKIRLKIFDEIEFTYNLGWENPNCLRKHWWWRWRLTLMNPECKRVDEALVQVTEKWHRVQKWHTCNEISLSALYLRVSTREYKIRKTGREKTFLNANNSDDYNWNTNEFIIHVNGLIILRPPKINYLTKDKS